MFLKTVDGKFVHFIRQHLCNTYHVTFWVHANKLSFMSQSGVDGGGMTAGKWETTPENSLDSCKHETTRNLWRDVRTGPNPVSGDRNRYFKPKQDLFLTLTKWFCLTRPYTQLCHNPRNAATFSLAIGWFARIRQCKVRDFYLYWETQLLLWVSCKTTPKYQDKHNIS